jgi:hypothetical protein
MPAPLFPAIAAGLGTLAKNVAKPLVKSLTKKEVAKPQVKSPTKEVPDKKEVAKPQVKSPTKEIAAKKANGGSIKSPASKRADGCVVKGKTKGRFV